MNRDDVVNAYFEWMYDMVCENRGVSYRKLLTQLHSIDFRYSLEMDRNRADNGVNLRWIFAMETGYDEDYLTGPCSVLEMMIALSMSAENIMDDPAVGNRTGQWFWGMIVSLGLGSMMDSRYDRGYVHDAVSRFLDREYEPNGKGGLFTLRHSDCDVRDIEIWHQMCRYLDEIM